MSFYTFCLYLPDKIFTKIISAHTFAYTHNKPKKGISNPHLKYTCTRRAKEEVKHTQYNDAYAQQILFSLDLLYN